MKTLTYSNTFTNKEGDIETKESKVLVENETQGHELIAQWNTNSSNFCKSNYHYQVVSINKPTLVELDTLSLY